MTNKKPLTTDAIRNYRDDTNAIVLAGEAVDMRFPIGGRMSLRGAKLFHLLVQQAGADVIEDKTHVMTLASLNESFHVSIPELVELVEELHTTTLSLKLTDTKGRTYTKSGPILSDVEREDEHQSQAVIRFEFSKTMRRAIANSNHWSVISKRAVLAFESKYSLRLYTVLSLRAGLRKTSEDFSLDDFRAVMGVPFGKLTRWQDLKKWVIEAAIAEVNQLAGFHAGYVPLKQGRRVVGIRLTWGIKDRTDMVEAMKELERSKVGRKVRRQGNAETITAIEGQQRERIADDLNRVGAAFRP